MDNSPFICKALEDLPEILHSEMASFELLYCAVNNSASWDVKPQFLNFFELSFYKGTRTQVTTDGRSFSLEQNCMTLFDIYKGIQVTSFEGSYHYITFRLAGSHQNPAACLRIKNICKVLECGIRVKDDSTFERQFYEIHREFLMKKPYFLKRICLLIQDMLILLLRSYKPSGKNVEYGKKLNHTAIIDEVLLYLEKQHTEAFNLEDIAAFTGYTPRYIDTIFRQATGCTIIQYLTNIRIESSKKALLSGSRSITEIALECGFNSSSYFCKVFKKATGLSPSAYRMSSI